MPGLGLPRGQREAIEQGPITLARMMAHPSTQRHGVMASNDRLNDYPSTITPDGEALARRTVALLLAEEWQDHWYNPDVATMQFEAWLYGQAQEAGPYRRGAIEELLADFLDFATEYDRSFPSMFLVSEAERFRP